MNNLINKITFRSKNSILFMILVGFLLSLILILFNFDFSINEYLKNVKEKNIDWRSVLVDTEDLNNIEKFKSIDHVTQVTDINFFIYGFFIDKSQNITLYALNENELNNLEIVNGNKNVQGNNLICPKKFKTVGSTFSRNFKRIRYTASRDEEILDERDETFYISANYDSKKIMLDGVTCFTSLENLERIARYTDYNEDVNYSLSTINIIVDNIKNIDYVKEELKKIPPFKVMKNAALMVGNYFVKGLSIAYHFGEGFVKNEKDNRFKSGVTNAYEESPLSYIGEGEQLDIKVGDDFYLVFKTEEDVEEPNYTYTPAEE